MLVSGRKNKKRRPGFWPWGSDQSSRRRHRSRWRRVLLCGLGTIIGGPLVLFIAILATFPAASDEADLSGVSAEALADIPAELIVLYQEAASARGLDWAVLAGIGKLECDHGRSQLAGCNPPGTVNQAGARGPMQFLGSTWLTSAGQFDPDVSGPAVPEGQERQGYATDGDGDGIADPWSAADAIHAAARYLERNGAPGDYRAAIWAYNHSDAYVASVLRWAETYQGETDADPAGELISVDGAVSVTTVQGITVHTAIAGPLEAMIDAAGSDGVTLTGGGYRSSDEQIELRRQHCGTSQYAIYEMPSSQCSPPTARPGTSMHEQGLAVDFENCSSRSTACFQWLAVNAATYGFFNLPSEPWHWSIDGS